ncbi:MAG TPA: hypothetical protein VGN04_05655 [Herbaspirillum sp.]
MIAPISNQVPRGDNLMQAINEYQRCIESQDSRAQIQRGFEASDAADVTRISHADFMAALKSEIMARINAR